MMPRVFDPLQGLILLAESSSDEDDVTSHDTDENDEATEEGHASKHSTPEAAAAMGTGQLSPSSSSLPELIAGGDLNVNDCPTKQRGTGRVFPTSFTPFLPTIAPIDLFPGQATFGLLSRYIYRLDHRCVLLFTDGSCVNNGKPDAKAAWAVVHGPGPDGRQALVESGRLENQGPFGDPGIQSSNRAELRAVIAALRLRHWSGEGFSRIVIATDSEYVTVGSTEWAKNWIKKGWRTCSKSEVKNKDMWEMLLGEVERWQAEGVSVLFWRILRDWNTVADAAAKKTAEEGEDRDNWSETMVLSF